MSGGRRRTCSHRSGPWGAGLVRASAPERWRLLVVCLLACALVVGVAVRAVPTLASWNDEEWVHGQVGTSQIRCGTDTTFSSQATGRFLGGSVLGTNLDTLASVRPMALARTSTGPAVPTPSTAANLGSPDPRTSTYANPLAVSALGGIVGLDLSGLGVGLPAGSAGALNQYTQVSTTGRAVAASGLVNNSGGVLVTRSTPPSQLPQPAKVGLSTLLPGIQNVSDVRLSVGAVGSSAALDYCPAVLDHVWGPGQVTGVTRSYGVAGLGLEVDSPLVGSLVRSVSSTVTTLDTVVASLVGTNGLISQNIIGTVTSTLGTIAGALGLGAASGTVTITNLNLSSALGGLLTTPLTDGTVTVDLVNGRVLVDLASLLGDGVGGLNDLPPNTELVLNSAVVNGISARAAALVSAWSAQVTTALLNAIRAATLTIDLSVSIRILGGIQLFTLKIASTTSLGAAIDGTSTFSLTTELLGLVGVLNAALALLGLPTVTSIINQLVGGLTNGLAGPLANLLTVQLVNVVTGLTTTLATTTASLVTALDVLLLRLPTVLSLAVNVQPDRPHPPPGAVAVPGSPPTVSPAYSVTALRVGLADVLSPTGFAYLQLATSTAGPVTWVR